MYTSLLTLVLMTAQTLLIPVRSSVSLTVEGGVSLVSPHCPGTVRLFCEGVELTTLTWRYNGDIDIADSYHLDDSITTPTKVTSNPAFVSVQLTAVSQNSLNPVFGNFTSILTVDLSQLEQQNIMSISCGDPATRGTVPVDVHIVQDTVQADPQLHSLSVQLVTTLEFDITVFAVLISWMKLQPVRCVHVLNCELSYCHSNELSLQDHAHFLTV